MEEEFTVWYTEFGIRNLTTVRRFSGKIRNDGRRIYSIEIVRADQKIA